MLVLAQYPLITFWGCHHRCNIVIVITWLYHTTERCGPLPNISIALKMDTYGWGVSLSGIKQVDSDDNDVAVSACLPADWRVDAGLHFYWCWCHVVDYLSYFLMLLICLKTGSMGQWMSVKVLQILSNIDTFSRIDSTIPKIENRIFCMLPWVFHSTTYH